MPNLYYHRPLHCYPSGEPKQFRILKVLGGRRGSPLKCELLHHDLPGDLNQRPAVEYEALSWTWGEEKEIDYIEISGQPDRQFPVKPNLKVALEHLRHHTQPRNLWVDFVCIDQGNLVERASQVRLIFFIYSQAFNVCIWLGTERDRSYDAFEFVNLQVTDLRKWPVCTAEYNKDNRVALAALMDRKWFSRRWVVQELASAVRASVHCSNDEMNWTEFENAVAMFEENAARMGEHYRGSKDAKYDHTFFGDVAHMGATRLVHLKKGLFRLDDDGCIEERMLKLASVVSSLSSFDAQEPHDLIYSILSIAKDTWDKVYIPPPAYREADEEPTKGMLEVDTDRARAESVLYAFRPKSRYSSNFSVNYDQDFFLVCKLFLKLVMSDTERHNLDWVLRPWSPFKDKYGKRMPLPSWIPTIERAAFRRREAARSPGRFQMVRQNADPLVGQTTHDSDYLPYGASSVSKASTDDWKLFEGAQHEGPDRSLIVTGFVIDKIHQRQDASQHGNLPQEWLILGKWLFNWNEIRRQPDDLWRTLVADRGPAGTKISPYYQKAFTEAVEVSEAGIDCLEVDKNGHSILSDFMRRMKAVVMNRRLFKAKRGENLGLAPKAAMDNDCKLGPHSVILSKALAGNRKTFALLEE